MNCKKGDMAIIIANEYTKKTAGTVVQVNEPFEHFGRAAWTIDREIENYHGIMVNQAFDAILRPVSGLDLGDELEATRPALSEKALDRLTEDLAV